MKTIFVLAVLIVASPFSRSQTDDELPDLLFCQPYNNEEGLYVAQEEVSIGEWFGFLTHILEEEMDTARAKKLMPKAIHSEIQFFVKYFKRNFEGNAWDKYRKRRFFAEGYRGFYVFMTKEEFKANKDRLYYMAGMPVTGITIDMAKEYLQWVKTELMASKSLLGTDYEITVSLPTPKQWTEIAKNNLVKIDKESNQTYSDSVNSKGCDLFNFKSSSECEGSDDRVKYFGFKSGPVISESYFPSSMGYYCLFGNVAELTSEEGIAKGGSFNHHAKDCTPEAEFKYNGPRDWIGFRYLVKIH